jgi:hypothetical protein
VAGRNSDNTFIKKMLKWEPKTPLDEGLAVTYKWIQEQYHNRKKGKRVVELKNRRWSPKSSVPFPTGCNSRVGGLISRSSPGSIPGRPVPWSWWRWSRPFA